MSVDQYERLVSTLPNFVNLGGIGRIIDAARAATTGRDDNEELAEQLSSLTALAEGLDGAGAGLRFADANNSTLISESHWDDYCRDFAKGIGEIDHVESYVDWDRFATDMKVDYAEIVVSEGEFAGTWYMRQ